MTRILIADDHPEVRRALKRMLSKEERIVVVGDATNGYEAVEACRQLNPDLVVMDASMPEMNGIEATRRICEQQPHVRVLGMSMYEDEMDLQRMMKRAGASAFVAKFAPPRQLRQAIRELVTDPEEG